jgi:uncharacterized protein (DUF1778 family)
MPRKQPKAEHSIPLRRERLKLSSRERKAFFDLLINPPKPSERLIRALAEHKRRVVMGR